MGIILKSRAEIESMRRANQVVVDVLNDLKGYARPGLTTMDLEKRARKLIKDTPARPVFLGYRGYPAVLCASINEEVIHGIPSDRRELRDGDILSLDFGVELDGFVGDAAFTVGIGKVDPVKARLMKVTAECLEKAVAVTRPGNRLSDIAKAVQDHAESAGFSVVYQFVGHGIGRRMHEDPQVPNCGTPVPDHRLKEGMVLAIEPMVNAGVADVMVADDGWTAITADGQPSAHFERSVAVGADGPDVLSAW